MRKISKNQLEILKGQQWPRYEIILILLSLLNYTAPTSQSMESKAYIKVTKFQVPSQARIGDNLRLACYYEISEGQKLYALKLFKDGNEFYRHTPGRNLHFKVDGINLEPVHSNPLEVILRNVNNQTAGRYTCLITVEATFKSISQDKDMKIFNRTSSIQRPSMNEPGIVGGGAGPIGALATIQQQQRQSVQFRKQQQQQQKFNARGHIAPTSPVHEGQSRSSATWGPKISPHSSLSVQLVYMLTLITSLLVQWNPHWQLIESNR